MAEPLWTPDALLAATGGMASGPPLGAVTGVSIDSRTLEPGDLYVAIKGVSQDGHAFVGKAFEAGAAAALVAESWAATPIPGSLVRVADPLEAMRRLGIAARARTAARIAAITGSVGKTGTKEALRRCLALCGRTHASEKSYNNHWGVPLTLARMPAETDYGVFEIGMNHAGEIAPLTRLVRPHVAIVTTVGPVHIEFFPSESAIADAKAEIFEGLEPGGIAILNRDNVHYERLRSHALARGANVVCFGRAADADVRLIGTEPALGGGSHVHASIEGVELRYLVGAPGAHFVMNSLAVLAAVRRLGADVHTAAGALAELSAPVGRGERTRFHLPGGTVLLIDESYNANPASLAAALAAMAGVPRSEQPRRIAVIGDMRELGARSAELHRALKGPIEAAEVDLVFACGPFMKELFELLPEAVRGGYAETSDGLRDRLIAAVRPGDVVMIKGSLGTRMGPLVEAMKQHFGA